MSHDPKPLQDDDRIQEVDRFQFEISGGAAALFLSSISIYGEIQIERWRNLKSQPEELHLQVILDEIAK